MDFGSILDQFFDDFSMLLASLFRDHFLMIFLFFPNRFLNRANPKIIDFSLVRLFCIGHFSHMINFSKIFYSQRRFIFAWIFIIFMTFSASIFAQICSSIFNENGFQNGSILGDFGIIFRNVFGIDFWSDFETILVPFLAQLLMFFLTFRHLVFQLFF